MTQGIDNIWQAEARTQPTRMTETVRNHEGWIFGVEWHTREVIASQPPDSGQKERQEDRLEYNRPQMKVCGGRLFGGMPQVVGRPHVYCEDLSIRLVCQIARYW